MSSRSLSQVADVIGQAFQKVSADFTLLLFVKLIASSDVFCGRPRDLNLCQINQLLRMNVSSSSLTSFHSSSCSFPCSKS